MVDENHYNYGRGTLVHEIVHALDLAMGNYHADYPIREKRAGFFENFWREHHGYPLRTTYANRFPVLEYQRVKAMGRIEDYVFYHYRNNNIPPWAE